MKNVLIWIICTHTISTSLAFENLLRSGVLSTFIQIWSLGAGVVEGMFAAGRFLTAVSRWILGQVSHVMNSMWAMRLNFFNISGILFTIFDFLIMIAYLGAYFLIVG